MQQIERQQKVLLKARCCDSGQGVQFLSTPQATKTVITNQVLDHHWQESKPVQPQDGTKMLIDLPEENKRKKVVNLRCEMNNLYTKSF